MELSHEHVSSSFGPLHASYNTSDEDAKLMSIQQRLNPPSPPQECNSSSSDDDSDTMDCSSSSELSEASKRFFDEYVDTMRAEIGREIQDDLDKEDRTRYFQQQLFLFIKSVVFRWFWDASDATTVSCMDSEDMMKHKLYGQVLMSYGNLFCCNVSKLAYARVIMMRGEILRRIDDDLNHPAIKTLDQILHWREVHIKRKQKRAPLANTFKDVWMLQDHEHQRVPEEARGDEGKDPGIVARLDALHARSPSKVAGCRPDERDHTTRRVRAASPSGRASEASPPRGVRWREAIARRCRAGAAGALPRRLEEDAT